MSGAWFALAAVAVGLVIRWYIIQESKLVEPTGTREKKRKKK
jgi:hypothetical protein